MPRPRNSKPRDAQRTRVLRTLYEMDVWGWQAFQCHEDLFEFVLSVCSNPWVQQDFGKPCCKSVACAYERPCDRWRVIRNPVVACWAVAHSVTSYSFQTRKTQKHGKEFAWALLRIVKHTLPPATYWLLKAQYARYKVRALNHDPHNLPWKRQAVKIAHHRLTNNIRGTLSFRVQGMVRGMNTKRVVKEFSNASRYRL